MDIPSLADIIQVISYLITIPIPEYVYIYFEKWYAYIITFLVFAVIFYILTRTRFRFFDENYFALKFGIVILIWGIILVLSGWYISNPLWAIAFSVVSFLICGVLCYNLGDYGIIPLPVDDFLDLNTVVLKISMAISLIAVFYLILAFTLSISYIIAPYTGNVSIGHISADVDPEYKIGHEINMLVSVGGPNTGLSVALLNVDSKSVKEVSSLVLYSNTSDHLLDSMLMFNGSLQGRATDTGKYLIHLNTTSMQPGHYIFELENPKYKRINSREFFHLSA